MSEVPLYVAVSYERYTPVEQEGGGAGAGAAGEETARETASL